MAVGGSGTGNRPVQVVCAGLYRYLRILNQEAEENRSTDDLSHKQQEFMEAFAFPGEDRFDKKLRIEETLTGPIKTWYARYRWLSLRTHPSLATVELCYDWRTGDAMMPPQTPFLLGFASMLTWHAVLGCSRVLGLPDVKMTERDYFALGIELNRFAGGNDATG